MSTKFVLCTMALALSGMVLGCKHKPGDKCQGSGATCVDVANAISCANGTLVAIPCRGSKGCVENSTTTICDESVANAGEACISIGTIACSVDKKAALECEGGKFVVSSTCKGSRGCEQTETKISCDNDLADVGDACHDNGDYACSVDKKAAYKCVDHKFALINACRGSKGCRVMELPEEKRVEFSCDDSLSLLNDACNTNGDYSCSVDQKTLLGCKENKYVFEKACPGGCSYDEAQHTLSCADASGAKSAIAKQSAKNEKGNGAGASGSSAAKPAAGAVSAGHVAMVAAPAAAGAKPGATAVASAAKPTAAAAKPPVSGASGKKK